MLLHEPSRTILVEVLAAPPAGDPAPPAGDPAPQPSEPGAVPDLVPRAREPASHPPSRR